VARILMVTPYPPQPDGIAAYAVQTVRRLRSEGHEVEVLSPGPSAAHHHLHLKGPRGALALAKRARSYDRVIIQFHPDVFFSLPVTPASIAKETLALLVAIKAAREVEVRVHEIDYRWGRTRDLAGWASRRLWRSVDSITVHTMRERQDFISSFGVRPDRVRVVEHGSDFIANTTLDQVRARTTLGIPEDVTSYLAIGFIQRHKGFDRAVRAFGLLDVADRARLDIVGAVRVEDEGNMAYFEELEELVASVPGAHLHSGFLSDEAFDRWIVASDALVLPYRDIWSSGVLERALLLGRRVIATDVGGLREQAGEREGVTVVPDDAGLAAAMAAVLDPASAAGQERTALAWPAGDADQGAVQQAVRERATALRGHAGPRPELSPSGATTSRTGPGSPEALRRMSGLGLPQPRASGLVGTVVKRVMRRLTAWEIDPVIHHLNAVHGATLDALDEVRRTAEGVDQRGRTATSRTSEDPKK
jgi:glycosyltransferase involved in cell wall biosynthesis